MTETHRYGEWPSPFDAETVTAGTVDLGGVEIADGTAYWLERRPSESGRGVIVRADPGETDGEDVTPEGTDVRTLVHEYGGGDFTVADDTIFFSRFCDQRICRQPADGSADPEPITPEPETERGLRYADFVVTPDGNRLYAVRERHEGDGTDDEAVNELVMVPTDGGDPTVVAPDDGAGHDFYSFPRLDADGDRLAWTTWDHPNMPWDGTELHVADVDADGTLSTERVVLGGPEESVFQPSWNDGHLYAVSDRTGWWNLYRTEHTTLPESPPDSDDRASGDGNRTSDDGNRTSGDGGREVPDSPAPPGWEAIRTEEAEYGTPQWVFDLSTYVHLDDGRIAAVRNRDGRHQLGLVNPDTGSFVSQELPFSVYSRPHLVTDGETLAFHGAGPAIPRSIVRWTPDESAGDSTDGSPETLRQSFDVPTSDDYLPTCTHFSYPTDEDGGSTAYAYYYPPTNPDVTAPEDDHPPLVVTVHGGPTSQTLPVADLERAYLTSRGFAVVDVNYRGSTGYGRAYRDALDGNWGVVDTRDCVTVAQYLGHWGVVDPDRLSIRGGSAGGYATLAALAFHDSFDAGVSYYGVADLRALATHTHKFESRYLDGLVGPLPEAEDTYEARSPATHADEIDAPLLALQGGEDRVVPPEQAEELVEALVETGTPYAYVEFPDERHGFRDATTREVALETETGFYAETFDLDRSDVPAVELDTGTFRRRHPTESN